jgi:hypothetical protein
MYFALPIVVGIPRPLVAAVVHCQMHSPRPPDLGEAPRLIAVNRRVWPHRFFVLWLHCRLLRVA